MGRNLTNILSKSSYSNRTILFAISTLTAVLVIDTSIIKISDLSTDYQQLTSSWKIIIFSTIAAVYIVTQHLILNFVKGKNKQMNYKEPMLQFVHKTVTIVQYTLAGILIVVLLQMIMFSYYNVVLLVAATGISYSLAITMMILLVRRFLSWFMSDRNYVVFSYALAAASVLVNAVFTVIFVSDILVERPVQQFAYIDSIPPFIVPGSSMDYIYNIYATSSVVTFILTWVATSLLLRSYSRKLGVIKYWIIVSLPLAYFMSQFLLLFASSMLASGPVFFGILFSLLLMVSKPAGGILFGLAFWSVSRTVPRGNVVRDYMIISAYGLLLLFVSNQAIALVDAPYPPFGLATVSIMGLSSYLVLIGVYSSAISVAQDSKLRQSIRNVLSAKPKLLDSIGKAQMEQQIERTVIRLARDNQDRMTEETGIGSSLTEDEMKRYLEQVIKEVKKDRIQTKDE